MKRGGWMKRGKPLRRRVGLKRKGRSRFPKRRDPEYLTFVKSLPCLVACRPPHVCHRYAGRQPVEPAHIKTRGSGGDDVGNVVPLCPAAHDEQEGRTVEFERRYGVNLRLAAEQIAGLYRLARDEARSAQVRRGKPG